MFASLLSLHFSSARGIAVAPGPFCSLAFRVAAPRKAANQAFSSLYFVLVLDDIYVK